MPKFITHGKITAPFKGYSLQVAHQVGNQHTGQDEYKGYGYAWMSDNDGIVYKVWEPTADFNWAAVHMLVPDGDDWCEVIPLGHASKIVVKEGDFVHTGQLVGYEGNHGEVYSGGRKVTVEERVRGSRLGAHNHRGIRPIKLVDTQEKGAYYLEDRQGRPFKFQGKYCKIKNINSSKGWVDPMTYYPKVVSDRFELMALNAQLHNDYKKAGMYTAIQNLLRSFNS